MIEICLVKSASTSVALRNWALRLWEEIKKSCFFRLSVSYDRISSQLRGVYAQTAVVGIVLLTGSTVYTELSGRSRTSKFRS